MIKFYYLCFSKDYFRKFTYCMNVNYLNFKGWRNFKNLSSNLIKCDLFPLKRDFTKNTSLTTSISTLASNKLN